MKREQVTKQKVVTRQPAAPQETTAAPDQQALKDDLDALLDEVDGVLEQNAEEFVKQYVQKGGE